MSSFSVVCNNGFSATQHNLGVYSGKIKSLRRFSYISHTSFSFPSVGFYNCCKSSQCLLGCNNRFRRFLNGGIIGAPLLGFSVCCKSRNGVSCNSGSRPVMSGNREDKETHLGKRGNGKLRRRFSLRLRPRLRLLAMRLKRISLRSVLNDVVIFLRKNTKRVTLSTLISVVVGICYLFLKLTASPSTKVVPYSDLIMSLQSGSVTKVLLEEGSRRIYYNMNLQDPDTRIAEENTLSVSEPVENVEVNQPVEDVAKPVARNGGARMGQALNVWRKFSRSRSSIPEWQFCTRKIDHDEKFLLSLMREKGITYSSAPQSPLASMRNILITVISLWIPLSPLMWLLYRQLSAANSPAKKRRPNKQMVGFDDVEGVDAAKVELMEVCI